jgi:hypothetical protein
MMGGAYSLERGDKKFISNFGGEILGKHPL